MSATAVRTPERTSFLNFTQIYLPTPLVIVSRQNDVRFRGPTDLAGRPVALVDGYSTSRKVLAEQPGVVPHRVASPIEGLTAVASGVADAYVGVHGINVYLASKFGLSHIKMAARYEEALNGQRFAVRKDWAILRDILQKALESIPANERRSITREWVSAPAVDTNILLSQEQRAWLAANWKPRLGLNSSWALISFLDGDGSGDGIAVDVVRQLNLT